MNKAITTALFTLVTCVSSIAQGQLFHPLGLEAKCDRGKYDFSQPRMHVEGNVLYVCTLQGLYSKDLSAENSSWQLVGFEGIPLQDYVRRGADILALRYNIDGGFLLLSHDGGKTYEDITPDVFIGHRDVYNTLASLDQHPTDPDKLLVSSSGKGVFQSTDFGKTWQELTNYFLGNESASFIGYHPLNPSVIYNSGEDWSNSPRLNVSYDGGLTWEDHSPDFPGDNCVHRIAFHPTDPSRWIAGGEGVVYTTVDNGRSWNTQDFWDKDHYNDQYACYWYFTLYDAENSDIVYMTGPTSSGIAKIMCSTDGGEIWAVPQFESIDCRLVNDFRQSGDKLLIYTETDVYEVSKKEMLARSATSVKDISIATREASAETFDLQGRLVSNPEQGLYISHGKKVVIR